MISSGMLAGGPITKFPRDLSVCAPQYLSSGTFTSPRVSFSMRCPISLNGFQCLSMSCRAAYIAARIRIHPTQPKARAFPASIPVAQNAQQEQKQVHEIQVERERSHDGHFISFFGGRIGLHPDLFDLLHVVCGEAVADQHL